MPEAISENAKRPKVGLFVTCLVDLFRPNVGFSALELLEKAGCDVSVPDVQTCCGQPGYNSGDFTTAQSLARQVMAAFEEFDYVVGPSGSCMGMLREHYSELFPLEGAWAHRAKLFGERCYELTSFLTDVMGLESVDVTYTGKVTYHDSCSSLREMGVKGQPRKLLKTVESLDLVEMEQTEVCCGFGGSFCVKYPEISARLAGDKIKNAEATGAQTLLAGDMGCLMNLAGRLKRERSPMKVYHVAEVLAGRTHGVPSIGEDS